MNPRFTELCELFADEVRARRYGSSLQGACDEDLPDGDGAGRDDAELTAAEPIALQSFPKWTPDRRARMAATMRAYWTRWRAARSAE